MTRWTASPLIAAVIVVVVAAVTGCDDDTSGGGGAGGGSGGVGGVGGTTSASSSSTSGGSTCADCTDDQTCSTCWYVHRTTHSCHDNEPVGPDQFACRWLACQQGTQVCGMVNPAGDGCQDAQCLEMPSECVATPTCECLEQHATFSTSSCEVDGDGNLTVQCMSWC